MHCCISVLGYTASIAFVKPVNPSMQAISISSTPRALMLFNAELAERVRIDGVAYKDDGKKMFWAMFASNNGTEREMPIRYQKDEGGKIKEIDTPYMNAPYESDKTHLHRFMTRIFQI